MLWLKSFLLLYKALLLFGFFTAFVSSACSPESNDRNPISISLSIAINWRVNIAFNNAQQNTPLGLFKSLGERPDFNEIFLLKQPEPGFYDFRPFENFYRNIVITIPADSINPGAAFTLQNSTDGDDQKFTILCEDCNIQTDAEDWKPYHTSCVIKNKLSNLCMDGIDSNVNLTQVACEKAHTWDLYGRISPDASIASNCSDASTSLPPTTNPSAIQLSMGELVGIISGSVLGTTLIALAIGFWYFRRHKQYNINDKENDRVNVQFYNN